MPNPPDHQIHCELQDSVPIIRLSGRLGADAAQSLLGLVDKKVREGFGHFVLNMREVTYLASVAIGVIVKLSFDHRVKVAEPSEAVVKLMTLADLVKLLDIAASEKEAVEALRKGRQP